MIWCCSNPRDTHFNPATTLSGRADCLAAVCQYSQALQEAALVNCCWAYGGVMMQVHLHRDCMHDFEEPPDAALATLCSTPPPTWLAFSKNYPPFLMICQISKQQSANTGFQLYCTELALSAKSKSAIDAVATAAKGNGTARFPGSSSRSTHHMYTKPYQSKPISTQQQRSTHAAQSAQSSASCVIALEPDQPRLWQVMDLKSLPGTLTRWRPSSPCCAGCSDVARNLVETFGCLLRRLHSLLSSLKASDSWRPSSWSASVRPGRRRQA